MEKVKALLENEEIKEILEDNSALLEQYGDFITEVWPDIVKSYIAENIDYFVGETLEETYNNMSVFTEFATKQLLAELSEQAALEIAAKEQEIEESISRYM